MIQRSILQNYLNSLQKDSLCQIAVTDKQGIILASTVRKEVGQFHFSALELIEKKLPSISIRLPGDGCEETQKILHLLPLFAVQQISGVLILKGPEASVSQMAWLLQASLQMMINASIGSDRSSELQCDELTSILLYSEKPSYQKISQVIQKYRYQDDYPRLPILLDLSLCPNGEFLAEKLLESYPTLELYRQQDLLLKLASNRILLFKSLPDLSINCQYTASEVTSLLNQYFSTLVQPYHAADVLYYYGPIQRYFSDYSNVYRCFCWLEKHLHPNPEHLNRFSNYLPEFLLESIDPDVLRSVFDASIYRIETLWDMPTFTETVSALIKANMKLEAAAKLLFLHKNTIVFRLNKIRDVLGLDPVNRIRDANYLIMLYSYWCLYYSQDRTAPSISQ